MIFNLDGIGLSMDDLDLDLDFDIDMERDDLLALPLDRSRYRRAEHWETTEAERHFLDLPDFNSHAARARYFVREMARAALASACPDATDDDPVFPYENRLVSLTELLAGLERDTVDELLDSDPKL